MAMKANIVRISERRGFKIYVQPRITPGIKYCRWPGVKVEFIQHTVWLWLDMMDVWWVWFCPFQIPVSMKISGWVLPVAPAHVLAPAAPGSEGLWGWSRRRGKNKGNSLWFFGFPCSCFAALLDWCRPMGQSGTNDMCCVWELWTMFRHRVSTPGYWDLRGVL